VKRSGRWALVKLGAGSRGVVSHAGSVLQGCWPGATRSGPTHRPGRG
jgi:hypothetical protein